MTAWGSLERDVPRRNLRSWSLVSCENVYSLASELWTAMLATGAKGDRGWEQGQGGQGDRDRDRGRPEDAPC